VKLDFAQLNTNATFLVRPSVAPWSRAGLEHAIVTRGGQKPRASRALALGVSRFFCTVATVALKAQVQQLDLTFYWP
jgi:hypothetical protein